MGENTSGECNLNMIRQRKMNANLNEFSIDFKIVLTVRLCLRFPFVPKIPLYHVNGNRPIVVHHVWPPPKFHPFLFYGTKKYDEDKYVTQLLTHGDLSLIHNSERE